MQSHLLLPAIISCAVKSPIEKVIAYAFVLNYFPYVPLIVSAFQGLH
jgi:hypothetical protein